MKLASTRLGRVLLAILSGVCIFLATADFDIWPLAWVGLVPLLWAVLDERCTHPFRLGALMGLVTNAGGFYWIDHLLAKFGHLPQIAAFPLYLLLVGYQGLAFGFFAYAVHHLARHLRLSVVFLAPLVLSAVELVFPLVFPWYLAITQAWQPTVIQVAELGGPIAVSFVVTLANAALFAVFHARLHKRPIPWRQVGVAFGVVAVSLGWGRIRLAQIDGLRAAAPHVKVGVVQANIGITEKWAPGLANRHLAVHQRLSQELAQRGAELIVWPESSYPFVFDRQQTRDFGDGRKVQQGFDTPILFGAITTSSDLPYPYNSALMMDRGGVLRGRFDKNFLLVFGEYIPYYEHIAWVRELIPEMSNFSRGSEVTTFPFRTWRLGPMICYEDIIPAFGRRLVAEHPNLLINITNDAWFGATSEPYEHMALAVFRAVEHRLDLIRAVNTGTSVFVSASGRVYRQTKAVDPDETPDVAPDTLLDEVAMLEPTGLYGRLGDSFGGLCLIVTLLLGAVALARAGRPVVWRDVGLGAALMLGITLAGALIATRGAGLDAALRLLVRWPGTLADEATVTLGMLGGGAIGALGVGLLGAWRGRNKQRPWRLEGALAVLAVVLVPALALGRTEGATASLVFTSLGALALVRLAGWVSAVLVRR